MVTEPYQRISEALGAARMVREADILDDISPVADAVVAAATDANPKARYLVGIGQLTEAVAPAMAELDILQDFSAQRCGAE